MRRTADHRATRNSGDAAAATVLVNALDPARWPGARALSGRPDLAAYGAEPDCGETTELAEAVSRPTTMFSRPYARPGVVRAGARRCGGGFRAAGQPIVPRRRAGGPTQYVDDEDSWDSLYEDGLDFQTHYDVTEERVQNRPQRPEQDPRNTYSDAAEDKARRVQLAAQRRGDGCTIERGGCSMVGLLSCAALTDTDSCPAWWQVCFRTADRRP